MKLLFVTNLCPHYRVKTFETLARRMPTQFLFFSQGGERYWNERLQGRWQGGFPHEYLPGFSLGSTRITPALIERVWRSDADVILKCITGRFALPVTYWLARARRKPFVLWTGIWHSPSTRFHRMAFPLTRYVYRHADAIAVYGDHVKRYLIGLGVPSERIFVAAHAVDNALYDRPVGTAEREELRKALDVMDRRVILYAGRFDPEKGLDYLVQAVADLERSNVAAVFVGSGAGREELLRACQSVGLEARFAGYVPPQRLYCYYAVADVVVLPSVTTEHGREPWGLVINEAMNQARPVVATEAVGAAAGGLVRDWETGFIVPERDARALSAAIGRLLDDRELAARLGEAARREVAGWTNERLVDGFVAAVEYAAHTR